MRRPPRRRAQLVIAAGTFLLMGLAVAATEAALRLASPHYLDRVRGVAVYSPHYGWALRPGFDGEVHGVATAVNARGERGRLHTLAKTPHRTRVVMIGDSITFGAQVRDAETFSSLLESRGARFEVVNLAVEGYGTDQELIRLEREGLAYAPEVVVLNFAVTNDFLNNAAQYDLDEGVAPKPWFSVESEGLVRHDEHVHLRPLKRLAQWLADDCHLFHRLSSLLPRRAAGAPPAPGAAAPRSEPRSNTELTWRLIRRAAELAGGIGARFLLLLHPDEPAFAQRSPFLKRFCETARLDDLAVVDMGAEYRRQGLGFEQVSLDYQGHLRPLGHRFVADALEALLAEPVGTPHRLACRLGR